MIGTKRPFPHSQRPFVQQFGVGIATLNVVKLRQIVQRKRHIGMIRTERLFLDRQRPLVQGFGVGIATLGLVKPRQIVQGKRHIRMIGTKSLFLDRSTTACTAVRHRHSDLEFGIDLARLLSETATSG